MGKYLKKNRTWFMIQPKCEISGLKVSHPEVFISPRPKSNFVAELAKLGDSILLIKEHGYLAHEDLADALLTIERFIQQHYDTAGTIVAVLDIEHLEGIDSEARKQYIQHLKSDTFVASAVFFNLSPLFKFTYKLTKRLHLQNDLLLAADTYPQALDLASKRLARKNDPAASKPHFPPAPEPGLGYLTTGKNATLAEILVTELKLFLFNAVNRVNGVAIEYYTEELLRHIQSINWYEDGFLPPESSVYKHPSFRKVIDAIGFIKCEIDNLINERAEAERKLRDREAKYRQLVEHAKAGILEYDYQKNRILHVNDYLLQITEYSKEEILSMNPLDLMTQESRELFLQRLKRLMSGEKISQDIDYRMVSRSGKKKWVLFNTHIAYEKGRPRKANVVVTDITKLKSQQRRPMEHLHADGFTKSADGMEL